MAKVPAYIIKHVEALAKAHAAIDTHSQAIEEWVVKQGEDGDDFFYDYALDKPYEFDAQLVISALEKM